MLLSADVVPSDVMPSCSSSQKVLKIVCQCKPKTTIICRNNSKDKVCFNENCLSHVVL